MANKITSIGGTDWVDGEVVSHTDLIQTIEKAGVVVHEIYTGNGFDISGTSDTDEYELNAITSTNAAKYTYVKLSLTISADCSANISTSGVAQLKIQVKETGGSYGDEFAFRTIARAHNKGGGGDDNFGSGDNTFKTIVWIHTLSVGEKTNGCQFKILAQESGGVNSAVITNFNTIVELL